MTPATSPSGMSLIAQPRPAKRGDDRVVARPVEDAGGDVGGLDALGPGDGADIILDRPAEVDRALGVSGTDRQLVHIGVGRVEEPALFGNGEHGERVGPRAGGDRRAFERVERDVDLGPAVLRRADLLADIEHRRLVALALADDHGAVHRQRVERGAHRLDRGGIGGVIVAAPDPGRGGDRGGLGYPDHFEHEDSVEDRRSGGAGAGHRGDS